MSVQYFPGIGFSRRSSEAYFNLDTATSQAAYGVNAATAVPESTVPNDKEKPMSSPWAPWGHDNLLPNRMVKDIESCGALESSIDNMSRFSLGKGARPFILESTLPDGTEVLKDVKDNEINEWMEENDFHSNCLSTIRDCNGLGNYLQRFKFTKDGKKIGLSWHHDVAEMRKEVKDSNGRINNVYLSANFDTVHTFDKKSDKVLEIAALPAMKPAAYLLEMDASKRKSKEFAMWGRRPGWLKHYYSLPAWKSTQDWVDISKSVPKMKAAMYENMIRIKYVVSIHEKYWERNFNEWNRYTPEEKRRKIEELWDRIDEYLAGAKNAGKSIFITHWVDPLTQKEIKDITIEVIQDHTKQGEYLPDSAAADKQIMFSLGFNPAINGANLLSDGASGGGGSGSDIREAIYGTIIKGEWEREQISRILTIIRKVNGWLPGENLVWRFPGLVLTTLDKGKSTEKLMTGGN